MSPTKFSSTPLAARSPNTASPSKATDKSSLDKTRTSSMMDGKQIPKFEHTARNFTVAAAQGHGQTTYISPSDAMQSPTTKKLSEIKGRRFMNAKPQTLFAKTLNQNHESRNK